MLRLEEGMRSIANDLRMPLTTESVEVNGRVGHTTFAVFLCLLFVYLLWHRVDQLDA